MSSLGGRRFHRMCLHQIAMACAVTAAQLRQAHLNRAEKRNINKALSFKKANLLHLHSRTVHFVKLLRLFKTLYFPPSFFVFVAKIKKMFR